MYNKVEILILGDICPTADTTDNFHKGNEKEVFGDLIKLIDEADYTIANLEFPITRVGEGITKCGPILKGGIECVATISNSGIDALSLANNHIADCGNEGVLTTIEEFSKVNILTFGAGNNQNVAKKPLIKVIKGIKVGFMSFAEYEFNDISNDKAGANIFDPYYSFDQISETKKLCDYLVVLNHGGIEHYSYPSPLLQKKSRKMVESGADLVVSQHSHCVGCSESYLDGEIIYGQGNTIYGYRKSDIEWNKGLVLKVSLSQKTGLKAELEILPLIWDATGINLGSEAEHILEEFEGRSKKTGDAEFIQAEWNRFCQNKKSLYLPLLFGLSVNVNRINRLLKNKFIDLFYSKKQKMISLNLLRCESHDEVLRSILEKEIKPK